MTQLATDILDVLFHYEKKYNETKNKNVLIELDGYLMLVNKLIEHNLELGKEIKLITNRINRFVSFVIGEKER